MATVTLKNVMKIYPHSGDQKKKKAKKGETPAEEKKVNLQVTERGVVAVQQFNLDIADQEFIVLVGPSGCGKSTTLRMVAGLEEISEGQLLIDGKVVNDVAPKDRDIAMVFQSYALYPHMTVYENIAFSLKLKKVPPAEIDRKVKEAAEILGITQYLDRKPKALSGGQRQRVAIGRAIVREPKVLLMDEPLSNLDAKLRNQMRAEIIKLRQRIHTTFIYVTHDQTEAMTLGYYVTACGTRVDLPADMQSTLSAKNAAPQDVTLGIRPDHLELCKAGDANALPATVDVTELMGSTIHMHVNISGKDAIVIQPTIDLSNEQQTSLNYGAKIHVNFPSSVVHLFSKADEKSLL